MTYSAVSRRFSPDRKLRWMPTVAGKIIVGGAVPFSGFATRREAMKAAKELARIKWSQETPASGLMAPTTTRSHEMECVRNHRIPCPIHANECCLNSED